MEHELNYRAEPQFHEQLDALLQASSTVKVYGWKASQRDDAVISLIKRRQYRVEVYTFMNYAILAPPLASTPEPLSPATAFTSMSPEAELVWEASEAYVHLAMKSFGGRAETLSRENRANRQERYRVWFLFPDLPEQSRQDLCRVRCRFLGVDKTRQQQKADNNQAIQPGCEYQEIDAVELQKDAQNALLSFSGTQQEILRERFFVQPRS